MSKTYTAICRADSIMHEQNADSYNTKLDTFNVKAISEFTNYEKDTSITSHSVFTYFKRYKLEGSSINSLGYDSEASSEISEFVDFVKYNDIEIIFADLAVPRFAKVIVDEAGAQIMTLDSIEAPTLEESSNNTTFLGKEQSWVVSRWP